ncbi:MAG: glycoside hydrolase family 95 protein [Verrucomicrobiota bacterium]|jgi:alpha-L-fucosidase 2
MRFLPCHALAASVLLAAPMASPAAETNSPLTLFYTNAAAQWTEALPIGNGRLGAMIFGGVDREHLQLNEGTLWAGGPYDPNNTNALAALPEVRKLIFDGKYDEASELVARKMMAVPLRQMPYETLGDLWLDFGTNAATVEDYRRDLDLDTALATVSYAVNGVRFKREVFASQADHVIVIHLTADQPRQISFTVNLTTPQKARTHIELNTWMPSVENTNDATIVMDGVNGDAQGIKGALKFQARVRILENGGNFGVRTNGDPSLTVAKADSVTLLIAAATSYKNYHDVTADPEAIVKNHLDGAYTKWATAHLHGGADTTLADHIAAHQKLFRRVALDLGRTGAMSLPTNVRIAHFAEGNDPQLAALYFQFARYLLICCSQPGGQPATLQGLWNDSMTPPWDSKYTININTEMNYWPAETCNLSECVEPLTQMVLDLAQTGARTAEVEYGAHGWVAHHNTDLWRATAPIDGPQWGMWPMGGAWLCQNLWEHYLFTQDTTYLNRIYPAMKGAAQFFLDSLVEEPTHHWLVTCPSLSPENQNPAAQNTSLTAGPTMDLEILRDLFGNCVQASAILGTDRKFARRLIAVRARLAPLQVGSAGQLQEWLQDLDLQSRDLHHRHVSHLYGLFPSAQIDALATPDLAAAARKSLEIRGDQATGWATAWRLNLWARLHDGDHAYRILQFLLSPARTYPDLFDAHPPFQIDGNFGGASGLAELLLQSQNNELQFLPALPSAWPNGSVRGLRARGGFEIDLAWHDGQLSSATIHSLAGNPVRLRYGQTSKFVRLKKGQTYQWDGQ